MEEDGLQDRRGPPIVQVWGSGAQTPEGSGTHFGRLCRGLGNSVTQATHLVEEQIGVKIHGFEGQGSSYRAGPRGHGRFVASHAVDLGK